MAKYILIAFLILTVQSCSTVKLIFRPFTSIFEEHSPVDFDKRLPIMQGNTDRTSTILVITWKKPIDISYQVVHYDSKKVIEDNIQLTSEKFQDYPGRVDKIKVSKLTPGEDYRLVVLSKDDKVLDSRRFSTLNNKQSSLKFGVTSCTSDSFQKEQKIMWKRMQKQNPDVLFMIGDNIYADMIDDKYVGGTSKPSRIIDRYFTSRERMDVFKWEKLIPIFGTWDDHDYGVDNGDKNFEYKAEANEIFKLFYPRSQTNTLSLGPGVSFSLKLNQQKFIFLDGRTFRDNEKNYRFSQLGKKQTNWVFNQINQSDKLIWLIKGDQFFGGYHPFESFERQNPEGLKFLLTNLNRMNKQVLFISGDRHLLDIVHTPNNFYNKQSYEFTTSAMHSIVFPGAFKKYISPKQIFGADDTQNFMTFEVSEEKDTVKVLNLSFGIKSDKPIYTFSKHFKLEKP